jgi:hypothetical protein
MLALLVLGCDRLDVHYEPTPPQVVDGIMNLADVRPGDFLIDLGSGDGRIPIAAAKRGARALGVDLDPQRIRESNDNARAAQVTDRVVFREQNLFETDVKDATVVTLYLFQHLNLQLRPRLLTELRPGARIVSHTWHMGEWRPDGQETIISKRIYLWIVPAPVAGRWRVERVDGRPFDLELRQHFQEIAGTAEFDGRVLPLAASLSGTMIEFSIDFGDGPRRFQGRIDGREMSGAFSENWRAMRLP